MAGPRGERIETTHHLRGGAHKGVECQRVMVVEGGKRRFAWRRKDTGEQVDRSKVERRTRTVRR